MKVIDDRHARVCWSRFNRKLYSNHARVEAMSPPSRPARGCRHPIARTNSTGLVDVTRSGRLNEAHRITEGPRRHHAVNPPAPHGRARAPIGLIRRSARDDAPARRLHAASTQRATVYIIGTARGLLLRGGDHSRDPGRRRRATCVAFAPHATTTVPRCGGAAPRPPAVPLTTRAMLAAGDQRRWLLHARFVTQA